MPTLSTSTLWVEWTCRFDQDPTSADVTAAQTRVQQFVQVEIGIFNNSEETRPATLIPFFEWSRNPRDPRTMYVRVYLQGGADRPPGGAGTGSIKSPPPPPPPPPL